MQPRYKVGDSIQITHKIHDIQKLVNLFDNTYEYIYYVNGAWRTERQLFENKEIKEKPKNV